MMTIINPGEPTPEERQDILLLINELAAYAANIEDIQKKTIFERLKIADRMLTIQIKLRKFQRRYPNA